MYKQKVFSGIQPSGDLHLGNYLGAIKNWQIMQEKNECIFCVVDLHAITVPQDPKELRKKTVEVARAYLAAGIDPERSTIFVQSAIAQHTELMWILNTITKTGDLFKMTQFKDKTRDQKEKETIDAGLLNYPVLMAADILLYDTEQVPVGEDQVQHVEITRKLARKFNKKFGEILTVPNCFIKKEGKRIMSLDDPLKKMSKSSQSENSRINLLDSPEVIRKKIAKAVTDSGQEIIYSDDRPALYNLINIYSLLTEKTPKEIEKKFEGKSYKEFKDSLAEKIIEFLSSFQKNYQALNEEQVIKILDQGAKKARAMAEQKMEEVKKAMGMVQ